MGHFWPIFCEQKLHHHSTSSTKNLFFSQFRQKLGRKWLNLQTVWCYPTINIPSWVMKMSAHCCLNCFMKWAIEQKIGGFLPGFKVCIFFGNFKYFEICCCYKEFFAQINSSLIFLTDGASNYWKRLNSYGKVFGSAFPVKLPGLPF